MKFDDLGLNRRLYRKDSKFEDTDPTAGIEYADEQNGNNPVVYPPATAVAPGTIIQSSIWQTSGSSDRVELTPNDRVTAYDNGDTRAIMDDRGLSTYNNGDLAFRADDDGMRVERFSTGDSIIDIDSNLGFMIYDFDIMPVVYGGYYDHPTNVATRLPPGWLAIPITGVGGVIDILFIHFLGVELQVNVTPIAAHSRPMITNITVNSFTVCQQISIHGSQSFPVSGGGGGSVNVSGIYQGEDNTFMSSFYFTATRYIV